MDEKTRQAIALKRFSIISPVLGGNVKNNKEYFQELSKNPKMPITILYDKLISERIINPLELSRSSVYRYVADMVLPSGGEEFGESLRFSYQYPGEMWQGDVMYGPYIQVGKKKQQTYLHAFIDDATRMIMYSKFFYEQNFETLRICLKEGMLKNGIPRLIYTDNGKIYRSQQLEYICASMGCTLLHSQPYVPKGRGKIERYFNTVRMRFLSNLTPKDINSLESLNEAYEKWLDSDYQKKEHSALNCKTPHQCFIDNIDRVKLITDRNQFNENFLLRISRKVCHDATIQVENILFETDPCLAGKRLEVRYEPEWLLDQTKNLQLYEDGKRIGEAKRIRFYDNAHVQRRFPGNRKKAAAETKGTPHPSEHSLAATKNTISFTDLAQGGKEYV